jgi:hypothetical protein
MTETFEALLTDPPGGGTPNDDDPPADARGPSPLLYWYRCHSCGWEAWVADGVRNARGCGNPKCFVSNLHVHSNRDGEMPVTLSSFAVEGDL